MDRWRQCLLQILQGTCPTGRHPRETHGPARRPDIRRDSEHGGQLVRYFPGRDNGGAGLGHGQGKRESGMNKQLAKSSSNQRSANLLDVEIWIHYREILP
ncbi:hypothetical protein NPIL_679371 [Nephila pilipes]|uniref:Uncharacterized protein n=1 Tax=Nephila pilipes TaxID=299642 RepID=A0A8X6NLI7_NEPPI|nr:hypothetical protein NPIL_679371 [Nephila pilipes]